MSRQLESWLRWVLVTGISGFAAVFIASALAEGLPLMVAEGIRQIIGGILGGILLGLAQWYFLRPEVTKVETWVLVSALAWLGNLGLMALIVWVVDVFVGVLLAGVLGSIVYGLSQWLALYPIARTRNRWLLMTVAGWIASLIVGSALLDNPNPDSFADALLAVATSWALGGIIIGMIAIVALIILFPKSEATPSGGRWKWWPPLS